MLRKIEGPNWSPCDWIPVGVDVSEDYFDAAVQMDESLQQQRFARNKRGVNELRNWLKKYDVTDVHIWMEATGHLSSELAEMVYARGWKVTIVNARCIKHFAISQLDMNKRDKADARKILAFAKVANERKFKPWRPKNEVQKQLRDAQIELLGLKKALVCERNRRRSGMTSPEVKRSIDTTIVHLKAQIKLLHKESMRLIRSDWLLKRTYDVLASVRGLGEVTIALLLFRIDFDAFAKGRQLVKYAGLDVLDFESGKSVRKRSRISRIGLSDLRAALYWPAVVAIRDDRATAEFAKAIENRSKSKMIAICAVMARLLRTAFALVRNDRRAIEQGS